MRHGFTAFSSVRRVAGAAGLAGAALLANAALLASVAVLGVAACSSDTTLYGEQVPEPQQPAPSGTGTPGSPSVLGAGGEPASGAGEGSPGPVLSPSSEEPQPNATETNFFTAGCRVDADCGATRRCEFASDESVARDAGPSSDAGSDGGPLDTRPIGPPPTPSDAGAALGALPDAGGAPDAAASEPLAPRGRCVDRVAARQ